MNDQIPGLQIWGRPFKPVTLGIGFMMLGLVVGGVWNLGGYPHPDFQRWGAAVPAAALLLLALGYFRNDRRWTRYGLLLAAFAYMGRTVFLAIEAPLGDSLLLALGTFIIISGTYVLETIDRRGESWNPS